MKSNFLPCLLYPTLVLDYKGEDSETKFLPVPSFLLMKPALARS